MNFYDFIDLIFLSPWLLFFISLLAISVKVYIIYYLLKNGPHLASTFRPWSILLVLLISTIVTEAIWIPKLIQEISPNSLDYTMVVFFIRIAWMFYAVQAQALSLFLESLIEKQYRLSKIRIFSFLVTGFFVLYYLHTAIFNFHLIDKQARIEQNEYLIFQLTVLYMIPLIGISLYKVFRRLKQGVLPKILHRQLEVLLKYLFIPHVLLDFIAFNPFARTSFNKGLFSWFPNNYGFVSLSTFFLTYAVYVAAKKVIGLRFLNTHSHVQSNERFDFINDFKNILEQLGHITDIKELRHLTQTFFKEAIGVAPSKITFATRPVTQHYKELTQANNEDNTINRFLNFHDTVDCKVSSYLKEHKILIHDEIEFNNYYESTEASEQVLSFLKTINADIFLPIFDKQSTIAYIIVEREARKKKFYSIVERDEMLVFASYLSNVITLLNHKNLQTILQQEKELKEELFNKHQEIALYKESIRSFLRTSKERKIGIVFYKNNKLKQGNRAAEELLGINLDNKNNEGHPTKHTLRKIGRYVQDYKQPQSGVIQDNKGESLICIGFLNIDGSHVIILIHYPEIADVVKKQVDLLKDPSKWDYLLYLETTESGRLINKLFPSSSETFLNFKIDLLKVALNSKAVLIDLPEKDLDATVNIIHHITLSQKFEAIMLDGPEKNNEIGIKFFGINPIFGMTAEPPLFETLKDGTIFIKNVHFLSIETQRTLTNVIKYGYFDICKGTTRYFTDIRVICSTDQNLEGMTNDGFFYEPLYHELITTSLAMPSLLTLPEHELNELTTGLSEQAIKNQPLKNLLTLSIAEKNKIAQKRPVSLYELKTKVHQILERKTSKTPIGKDFTVEGAYYVPPELEDVKMLGKQALKDPKIMRLLYQTFKKQAEIAKFLGVNRSSVSRRLKTLTDNEAS